jgi:hypothetical protein
MFVVTAILPTLSEKLAALPAVHLWEIFNRSLAVIAATY